MKLVPQFIAVYGDKKLHLNGDLMGLPEQGVLDTRSRSTFYAVHHFE
jgi:hypothetical protein